ncbi:hypothetical protein [Serinicoccus kebangsaanensis]|uniref:hypothetical protein n=1 Tax=Serinicoccus kebangsaanensis TaxID=2602069 RepID=UPI00124D5184|nr:hypothetical protein [Serinicoccus kebangsaanensis]
MPAPNAPRLASARAATALGAVAAALAVTGCGQLWAGTADPPTVRPGELTAADGDPCPAELPTGEDPSGHGFGATSPAEQLPHLLEPEEAWLCRYDFFDRDSDNTNGTVLGWRHSGEPRPVAPEDLPALEAALDDLTLPNPQQGCNADLGPRWMVSYSHEGDLTGVVVDEYGCRTVRLTDDPHSTPPGADDQDGTVGGVLDGGGAVLKALGSPQ